MTTDCKKIKITTAKNKIRKEGIAIIWRKFLTKAGK
jgi:hypothetical protein